MGFIRAGGVILIGSLKAANVGATYNSARNKCVGEANIVRCFSKFVWIRNRLMKNVQLRVVHL
jgi:hypothetical protein